MARAALTEPDASRLYNARADEFADRYATVSFEQVHHRMLPHLPARGSRVLDVGAGSGRDALALARLGHCVIAAEPSEGLRRRAAQDDAGGLVDWIDDRLPDLARVRSMRVHFDLVLCSAVLIHVPPSQLGPAIATLAALLAPSGRLGVTVRAPVDGEPPALFHDHGAGAVAAAASHAGLREIDRWRAVDAIGRPRSWEGLMFDASA